MLNDKQDDKSTIRFLQDKLQKYEHLAIFPAYPQDTIVAGMRCRGGGQECVIGSYICPWRGHHLIYTTSQKIELVDCVYLTSKDIEKKEQKNRYSE